MLNRLILLAAIVGGAYWYWSGPYQDRVNPDYAASLEENNKNMAQCIRGAAYKVGATGVGLDGDAAEQQCAEEFNVYRHEGQWHRYDMSRPDE